MGGRGSRQKGANGEREFFKLSNDAVADLDWPFRKRTGEVFFRHPAPRHSFDTPHHGTAQVSLITAIRMASYPSPSKLNVWKGRSLRDG
jgi:hypothetical protein